MTKKTKIGQSPGTLIYTGEAKIQTPILQGLKYNQKELISLNKEESLHTAINSEFQYWFDLKGIHDVSLIGQMGDTFQIHKLILEDILDPGQRIKIEKYRPFDLSMKHHEFLSDQTSIEIQN